MDHRKTRYQYQQIIAADGETIIGIEQSVITRYKNLEY